MGKRPAGRPEEGRFPVTLALRPGAWPKTGTEPTFKQRKEGFAISI
jgi:hypothetical protein